MSDDPFDIDWQHPTEPGKSIYLQLYFYVGSNDTPAIEGFDTSWKYGFDLDFIINWPACVNGMVIFWSDRRATCYNCEPLNQQLTFIRDDSDLDGCDGSGSTCTLTGSPP